MPHTSRIRTLIVLGWASCVFVSLAGCEKEAEPETRAPSQVRVQAVVREAVASRVALTGTVVPSNVSRVATGVSGKVEVYDLHAGDFVPQGGVIAKLREKTVEIQIAASQALANEKLERWNEMKDGFREEEVARAKAEFDAAQAAFEIWAGSKDETGNEDIGRLKRTEQAFQRGAITQDDYRDALNQHRQAKALCDAAEAEFNRLNNGYTKQQLAQAEAAYDAAAEEVKRLEDQRDRLTIVAPFDGYITEKMAEVGEWISEGSPVATLVSLNEVDVVANMEEVFLPLAQVGATVEVRFDALPGTRFNGTIERIVPKAEWESGSRSFPVRIRVANQDAGGQPLLKEGMLARVEIHGQPQPSLMVPKDAVSRSKGRPNVYALISLEDNRRLTMADVVADWNAEREVVCRVEPVDITEGMAFGNDIHVTSGNLLENQVVVTDGVSRLRAMQEVRVPPPEGQDANEVSQSTESGTGDGNKESVANR